MHSIFSRQAVSRTHHLQPFIHNSGFAQRLILVSLTQHRAGGGDGKLEITKAGHPGALAELDLQV